MPPQRALTLPPQDVPGPLWAATTELHVQCRLFQDQNQRQLIHTQLSQTTCHRLQGQEVILNHETGQHHLWLSCCIK